MKKTVAILIILVLSVGIFTGCDNDSCEKKQNTPKKTTAKMTNFPQFNATDFKDMPINNSIFSKSPVTVVNFWFTACPACVSEMPDLEKESKKWSKKGVKLMGINIEAGESQKAFDDAKKLLKSKNVTFTNVKLAPDNKEMNKYLKDIIYFPTTIFVNRQGKIIGKKYEGVINDPARLNEINRFLDKTIEKDKM